jgi:MFS family permease
VALVSNPIFGALSDRTHSRFGRRRPYLVAGVLSGCASLILIGKAPNVEVVLLGWCLAQLAFNAVLAALVAIVPDRIPAAQRGTVVGILGICMPVGQIAGTYLVQELSFNMTWTLVVPGLIGVGGILLLAFVLREESSGLRQDRPGGGWIPDGQPPVESEPRRGSRRDFSLAWLSRVLFTTGSCFLQAYQPFFLIDKLHVAPAEVARLIFRSTLVSAAMVVVWSLISGRLSDRTGRRKPFVMLGSTVQGVGLWMIAAADSYSMLLLGVAFTGTGHGIYEGVDLALVTEVLPDRDQHAAKDLGLLNVANTLPQVIAPLSAPAIFALSGSDYTLLFAIAGAVAVLGSLVLVPLRSVR